MSDDFVKAASSGIGAVISCLCSCACLAGGITFVVYLGKYAFDNPNKDCFWASTGADDDDGLVFPTEALAKTAGFKEEEIVDVHGRFVTWFLWGFIM